MKTESSQTISLYDYTDYRCFLREKFNELKAKKPHFSYRYFNRLAGIKSSGFLKLVMDGKRNLADDGMRMIAKGLKLDEKEKNFFYNLVKFNQALHHEEKEAYLKEILQNKNFLKAKDLLATQYDLFSHWYYVAILELIRMDSQQTKDAKWIGAHINPEVGVKEIKKAIKALKKLDLIHEDQSGNLIRKENMLTTPDEVQSVAAANFHIQMCQMAARAIEEEAALDREFSALTAVTSEKGLRFVKQEIQAFRKKIHSLLEQIDGEPKNVVAHVNFQLFKLSRSKSEK